MTRTLAKHLLLVPSICLLGLTSSYGAQSVSVPEQPRITVLYDAFGKVPGLHKDWGYSALVEANGKRILFDTGNNPDVLGANAKSLHVDLSHLDFVVMSHRHGDHMGGMEYLLKINPRIKIYAPKENFGVYGFSLPGSFYRKNDMLQSLKHSRTSHPHTENASIVQDKLEFDRVRAGVLSLAPFATTTLTCVALVSSVRNTLALVG